MSLIQAKQINKLLGSLRAFNSAFTLAAGGTVNLATTFTGKTPGGSDTAAGVFTSAPHNRVAFTDEVTGNAITDGNGNQVYGRIDSAFLCTFYTIVVGVETAYTVLAGNSSVGNTIKVTYGEAVQLKDINATDVINGLDTVDESDVDDRVHAELIETLAIGANGQTAFTLGSAPKAGSVKLFVNGQFARTFTHAGVSTSVTWVNTDYSLATTDELVAVYNV